jgi:hypothetical protein
MVDRLLAKWTNARRDDGLLVIRSVDAKEFIILPHSEGLPVSACPCCQKPFETLRTAQRTADIMFPLNEEEST